MQKQTLSVVLVMLVSASLARAQEPAATQGILPIPDYTGNWMSRSHLAGDFNGGRTELAK